MKDLAVPTPKASAATDDRPVPALAPVAGAHSLPRWQRSGVHLLVSVRRTERRFGFAAAALLVALGAEALSIFFAASWTTQFMGRYTLIVPDPFTRADIGVGAEYRIRLLGPVVAWALGLRGVASTMIPALANIPLLMILYCLFRRRHLSVKAAVLAVFLMATTQVTMTSRTLLGYQDSLAFLGILLAMAVRRVELGAVFLFLAGFADQRAFCAVPYLLVWHSLSDPEGRKLGQVVYPGLVYLAAVAAWFAASAVIFRVIGQLRESVGSVASIVRGDYLNMIKPGYLQLCYFMSFKAAWLFPVILLWLWVGRRLWETLILMGSTLAILFASLLVLDLSRASSFCFPAVILGILALREYDQRFCTHALAVCLLLNLITPFYQGMTTGLFTIHYPLVVEVARMLR
jgi:hypothetical protein